MKNDELYLAAYNLAIKGHNGQFRKNGTTPYFDGHILPVTLAVNNDFCNEYGEDINETDLSILAVYLVVATLHDYLEDVPGANINDVLTTLRPHASLAQIAEIEEALLLITKKEGESYFKYLEKLKANHAARYVKIRDLRHNMSDLPEGKQLDKYRLAEYYLTH